MADECGGGESWCPSLAACIVGHIQSCPPLSEGGADYSQDGGAAPSLSPERTGLLISVITATAAIVAVAMLNELAKKLVRRRQNLICCKLGLSVS